MKTMMDKPMALRGAVAVVAAMAMAFAGAAGANAAEPYTYPSDLKQPDLVKLLGDYENYWKPANAYDKNDPASFGKGQVVDKSVTDHDDSTTVAINNAAAKADADGDGSKTPTAQQRRALVDSDYDMEETLPDALGPVLGKYFADGLAQSKDKDGNPVADGPLAKTYALLENNYKSDPTAYNEALVSDWLSTGTAKTTFNHPRPYVDRTNGGYDPATLGIKKVPVWTDANGGKHDPSYDGMVTSGSFPSGHTTYAFSGGIGLATLLPQLGTEIVTRASEAGNNRIVLGVHYPLDIMGGRIDGEVANTALWGNKTFRDEKLTPAYDELQHYLAGQCVANKNVDKAAATDYDTVSQCVANLKANSTSGYTNAFTDAVSTKPVTDRRSAIDAYTARMTYGFAQTGTAGEAAKVPEGAENLLLTAFPTLTDAQRRQVLAASEIDSGYPLDATSEGYQRINLAKAYSANVLLSNDGSTVLRVTFGAAAPTVTKAAKAPTFADVTAGDDASHADDVLWLGQTGIAGGFTDKATGEVTFGGMRGVVRQDMAAFLYRLAGSPAFDEDAAAKANKFADVTADTPHYKEILWLESTGITEGFTDQTAGEVTFGGMRGVVRQDMAAFLHRFADYEHADPALGDAQSFTDVDGSTPHADDIAWLSRTGVAQGFTDSTFGGMRGVVRQDMAAFLHRMSDNVLH